MHALSMIDAGATVQKNPAPAKTGGKSEPQFDKVLNDKQQSSAKHSAKQAEPAPQTQDRQVTDAAEATATTQSTQDVVPKEKATSKQSTGKHDRHTKEASVGQNSQAEVQADLPAQVELQHTLVDLLKTLSNGESTTGEEGSDNLETLLADMVQQLDQTELHGNQVLAGVDLSALAAELKSLNETTDGDEQLAQLVAQLQEQITSETGLQENAALAAVAVATDMQPQGSLPVAAENNLAQARKLLQRAVDAVTAQTSTAVEAPVSDGAEAQKGTIEGPVVATSTTAIITEQQADVDDLPAAADAEDIDPRFAELLKGRTETRPVQQHRVAQSQQKPADENTPKPQVALQNQQDTVMQEPVTSGSEQKPAGGNVQPTGQSAKQMLEGLTHQTQHHQQLPVQNMGTNRAMPQTPVIQLPSGQQVAESQIFDQVVTHLSGSVSGDSGRMVLRLQPAELGSLRLELMVEGDKVRANLHAQSQQVQDVLERHLPHLRNALAEQGLKIDQFQVNIDKQHSGGQFENQARQQQQNGFAQRQPGWQLNSDAEEQAVPLAHLMQNGGGGISLHV